MAEDEHHFVSKIKPGQWWSFLCLFPGSYWKREEVGWWGVRMSFCPGLGSVGSEGGLEPASI